MVGVTFGASVCCPICETPTSTRLGSFTSDEAARTYIPPVVNKQSHDLLRAHLRHLWQRDDCSIMRCDPCDFGFSHPFVGGDELFYETINPDTPYPRDKWEFCRTRDELAKLVRNDVNLLEIGAGKGHFVKVVLELGWPASRIDATEYSTVGRNSIEQLGVRVSGTDVQDMSSDKRFGVVCLFQVLEHMGDLDGFFAGLDRITQAGTHLFLAVPNGRAIEANERAGLLLDLPPNHVSRWSQEAISQLAGRFGWKVRQCELEPPNLPAEMLAAFKDRFVRLSQQEGGLAHWILAQTRHGNSRQAQRLLKLAGAIALPSCWVAGVRPALKGARSANIWAHLVRDRV